MSSGGDRGGFGRGFGDRGDRGRGGRRGDRGDRRGRGGRRGRRGDDDEKKWVPCTKLGRLVKDGKIKSIDHIFLHSLPIKETEIIDQFLGGNDGTALKDEVMKIAPVQKQTKAGQRTRFRAYVAVGDGNGHLGLGSKCSKEVATAIRGAITDAKLNIVPCRRGFWGSKLGDPHTIPGKVTGKAGSVSIRLIPAPRGSGIVGAPITKKLLTMAGVKDCYSNAIGQTSTGGNFAKAVFQAMGRTYTFLTPDMWAPTEFKKAPAQEYTDFLARNQKA